MPVLTEAPHPGTFIVSERGGFYSRDAVMIAASQAILPGTVLGVSGNVAAESVTVTPAPGIVGNGVLTLDATAPIRADAIDGVYEVMMLTAGATADFEVLDPEGDVV